ncbi:MAG: error-prone DNA polymerase [Rhodospirillaceae bacterium]|nr:error-prone DNA polymerase [Rhodospirillaceae bacterium]
MKSYAELQTTSNFSFLCGASHPEEIVARSAELGHTAIAITDHNSLAGIVRAHLAARKAKIQLIVGAKLLFSDAPPLLCLPMNHGAYSQLSRLITLGRRRAPKGKCYITIHDFLEKQKDQIAIVLTSDYYSEQLPKSLSSISNIMSDRCYLALNNLLCGGDAKRIRLLAARAAEIKVKTVATNDVYYHIPERRELQDTIAAINHHTTIERAGYHLFPNAERYLKSAEEMTNLFSHHPEAISNTLEIANRCCFSLDELSYEYPDNESPLGVSPQEHLTQLTWKGAANRYSKCIPKKVIKQIDHELKLIGKLSYANYFLTVHSIMEFARERQILCQGRGSAANSAVCYCLGITSVDPAQTNLLFERFISAERGEPPDIDVDFEHERREEVIQYIYKKYGRERAGLAATVIRYRKRSAIREVARAMGLSRDVEDRLSRSVVMKGFSKSKNPLLEETKKKNTSRISHAIRLANEISGFPRHLSQHVGGFVITRGRLDDLVPITNAAMEERTTIEWDKDDLNALGILKIDVLGLGMLSCIQKAFRLLYQHHKCDVDLTTIPAEDPAVYNMLCKADTLGVFQVESRAQMTMLPRLKPRNFYDLVVEVAIVRPGPIQGNMVHPYLRRRNGQEKITFPSEALRHVLGRTYGVPLFQEQAMKIAIVAAGFTPDEADGLRRAMATFRRVGTIHQYRDKMIQGMIKYGYEKEFAERCFNQIEGFGEYGFPESHAASFALLVYTSSWLKCHYPAIFACALLNSQPMGFYASAQIIRDAREHGVIVYPPDVNFSLWDCKIELNENGTDAVRLGLRQIRGLGEKMAHELVSIRDSGNGRPFSSIHDFVQRCPFPKRVLQLLAGADTFGSMNLSRREALWKIHRANPIQMPLFRDSGEVITEPNVILPIMAPGEEVIHDYHTLQLSLKAHPLELLRRDMGKISVVKIQQLKKIENNSNVSIAGLVITRQRPSTANGVIFITLEDETGTANAIIWPSTFERYKIETLFAKLLLIRGKLQREGIIIHIIANHLIDMTSDLYALAKNSNNKISQSNYLSRDFK